ncbi:MAG: AMP-binding protein, partial [Nevskia sp.]|nr:AMP-binding protein [Nevskia sp.]
MKDKLESVMHESRSFQPPEAFRASSALTAQGLDALYHEAERDLPGFWSRLARQHLSWHTPFSHALDESAAPHFSWFADGRLNASHNALDRHLEQRGGQTALIFESDGGETQHISYRALHGAVCRFANALRGYGIAKGDRVVIYLPMGPQAIIAMLACARIGAIHSVVFGGFSSDALRDRIRDAGARLVV